MADDTNTDSEIDFDEDDPLAVWEAAFLPGWTWEAYEVDERADVAVDTDDDGELVTTEATLYRGRVKSPNTYGRWEYGSFSAYELRQAGAFRTDEDTGDWP